MTGRPDSENARSTGSRRGQTATGPSMLPATLVRQVIAGLPSGLVVVNAENVVVLVNSAARRMGVVDGDQLSVPEVVELVTASRFAAAERDAQLDLPPVPEPPLTRARPDQTALAVWAYARPLGDSGYISVVLDDITDSRRVEAIRRDFVANVSHELKTPVGALHVLAEAVSAASEDPVAVRRFASRMTHESARLARLVQEIIDLSRLQGAEPMPELTPVPVSVVLAEAVDRNRFNAQAQEITVAVIGAGGLRVRGDEGQLVTAVANLLDNAISYSPRGTRVVLGVKQTGNTLEISVADEGIGIAEKDLERVFERFYRADPARSRATGGTGLGLAIVKHIATNHGGSVSVWSAEGRGSTFTLRLPAVGGGRESAPTGEAEGAETSRSGGGRSGGGRGGTRSRGTGVSGVSGAPTSGSSVTAAEAPPSEQTGTDASEVPVADRAGPGPAGADGASPTVGGASGA